MAEIANAFRQIFGENGEYIHSEQGILTVEPFSGRNTEDPVSWLAKFERARTANRWNKRRLVDIAGGLMKGEAAAWFEVTRPTWGVIPRYDTSAGENKLNYGDDSTTNFTDSFNERFVTDQRKNEWHIQLLQLKQEGDKLVEEYTAKFLKLVKRVGIEDDAQK
jgi:hypothetical protein